MHEAKEAATLLQSFFNQALHVSALTHNTHSIMSFFSSNYDEELSLESGGSSLYAKLSEGQNTLRILKASEGGSIVMAFKYFRQGAEGKLERVLLKEEPVKTPDDCVMDQLTKKREVKCTWFSVVYSHDAEALQVWEISQVTIRKGIRKTMKTVEKMKGGDPSTYDFIVTQEIKGAKKYEYSVDLGEIEPLPAHALELVNQYHICPENVFSEDGKLFELKTERAVSAVSVAAPAAPAAPAAAARTIEDSLRDELSKPGLTLGRIEQLAEWAKGKKDNFAAIDGVDDPIAHIESVIAPFKASLATSAPAEDDIPF